MKINLNKLFEFAATSEIVLGRDCAEFDLSHSTVSRRHAVLKKISDKEYTIIDLESVNGVKVNGVSIKTARLFPGNVVQLGEVTFEVEGIELERSSQSNDQSIIQELGAWILSSKRTKKHVGW